MVSKNYHVLGVSRISTHISFRMQEKIIFGCKCDKNQMCKISFMQLKLIGFKRQNASSFLDDIK